MKVEWRRAISYLLIELGHDQQCLEEVELVDPSVFTTFTSHE